MTDLDDLKLYRDKAIETAVGAGKILLQMSGKSHIDLKGEINLVTDADHASESYCMENLLLAFPQTGFLGEEGRGKKSDCHMTWVVDPLDGTNNYAHGIPIYSVSIALVRDGKPVVGVVHAPAFGETYTAILGGGAFCNDAPIRVSATKTLSSSIVVTGFPYDRRTNPDNNLNYFQVVATQVRGIRRLGSAALDLCWIARGRFDAYWELQLSPWDFAAGVLIAAEAGGRISDLNDAEIRLDSKSCVATNGPVHDEILALLRTAKR